MGAIGERIRPIREALGMGRAEFAQLTGVSKATLISIEHGKQRPSEPVLEAIGRLWPEYAYWLMTGQLPPGDGPDHVSPDIEKQRQGSKREGKATG